GGACAEGFTCRRPTGFEQPWCLAVPFGQGDGVGSQGEDCSAHGATDCRPELDCVAGVAGSRVCAAPCDMASCEPGLRCVPRRVDGAHCLPAGGDLGAACEGDDGCDGGTCLPAEDADLRFCTVACDGGCPADTVCDGGWCWPLPPAPEVGLGAPCGPEVVCAAGVCASDPGDGAARCAAPCGPDGACEPGFTCREVGGQGLCFPGD
ncbi:MAG: hypothetical protein KC613_21005, partial [Myxococcales bacterium]|nr:hypothetical protein [Myxococcales bacterium]